MKTISLVMLFALAFAVSSMPAEKDESRDIIDNLLPMFGKVKINTLISQRSIEFIKRFFDINPRYYESIKDALQPEHVFLPEQDDLKWDTAQQEDFDILIAMVGDATFRDAVEDKYFLQGIVNQIESNPALIDRLESRVQEAGITWDASKVNVDRIGKVLQKQLTTGFLASFAPIAMQIMWFGKRDIAEDRINVQQVISQVKPHIMQFIAQHQNIINQVLQSSFVKEILRKAQAFLAANPAIYNLINTELAALGVQLPKMNVDWENIATTVISVLPSIINLFGKRDIERINIQQIVSYVKPVVMQFVAQHQNIINQVLQSSFVKEILRKAQAFLAANPAIYNLINTQLAALGVQLPRLDVDWQNIATTVISVLPSIISLFGK